MSLTKEKSKQNITRDIEVENNVTIARGSGEGIVGRGVFRNYYKGHMGKIKVGLAGVGWRGGEKMQTTVIEQQ